MIAKEKIEERIAQILSDERLAYKTAVVYSNAPLALIQLQMETELHTLQGVLQIPKTDIKKLRNEK